MKKFERIREFLADENPDAWLADGYEAAIIGVATVKGETVAVYDVDRCIDVLVKDGMDYDEANDHFSYDTLRGAEYLESNAPIFIYRL